MVPGARRILLLALAGVPACAQGSAWIREHYAKREVMVPMRDGTRLFTAIYEPRDAAEPSPILVQRTPYGAGPYGPQAFPEILGPSSRFAKEGFVFVYQDARGRMMSEGAFTWIAPFRSGEAGVDDSTDAYDTVAWLLENVPGNNGRVGMWGVSWPGRYAAAALVDAHPALKAVSPQAPIADWFEGDDFRRNGALWLPHLFNFIAMFGRPRPAPTTQWPPPFRHGTSDGYAFFMDLGPLARANERWFNGEVRFWYDVMAHGTYDAFWKARDLRPHLRNVRPAVLTVGGWFDAENLFGSLQVHGALARRSPATDERLVMGPWSHGGWLAGPGDALGDVRFGSATGRFFQARIEFPFFMHHLKGARDPGLPKAFVFQTGSNLWRRFEAWPPPSARPVDLWFQGRASLGFEPPPEPGAAAWVSDPDHPVPYFDGITIGMDPTYMVADQRFAGRRPDVATWRTPPLEQDLSLAGPIQAHLWVTTSGTDADWVVKVIDVYPDDFRWPADDPAGPGALERLGGYEQLVRGEVMRGKFRGSLERPEPFEPGRPAEVAFALNDVCHTFLKGHRIMVQVQSSWFPLMDRNPQVFMDIAQAGPGQFRKAEERVLSGPGFPSRLTLTVLP